jgi:hypothetical protein
MKRLLDAHVESSHYHISTQIYGQYYSADARSVYTESKTISVDVDVVDVSINPWKKEISTPSHILVHFQFHDTTINNIYAY